MATTSIHSITTTPVRALAYISNIEKTEQGNLIDSYMCHTQADVAAKEFKDVQKNIGTGNSKVLAQHIIQSFKPGEITPEQAFEIGKKLCERLLKYQYQYVLAVHTDKEHIHCHIIFNNTNLENGKTFETLENKGQKKSWETLRETSDKLCKEYNLNVIEEPKNKGKSWYEWDINNKGLSWKSQLKFAIDNCIMESEDFDEFLRLLREKNIETVYNPDHVIDLKFRMEGQERFARSRTLGWYYETNQIRKRIEQYQFFKTGVVPYRRNTKIINTDTISEEAKGLKIWAEIQNMKEASRVINILTQAGIEEIKEIENKSISSFEERVQIVKKLNELQHKIDLKSDVIKAVRQVKKYKPISTEYRAIKSDKERRKFAEKYAPDLKKYKGANAYLKSVYEDGKVPSEESLSQERNSLIERRKELNDTYKEISAKIKELDYARQAINDYLNINTDTKSAGKDKNIE